MVTHRPLRGIRFSLLGALAGIAAAAVFLAAAELAAVIVDRTASPLLAVGSFVIDIVPQGIKELAIEVFAEYDKIALLVGLGLGAAIAAVLAGILEARRPPLGAVALLVAGIASTAAILTRAGASPFGFVPPLIGTVAGIAVLVVLGRRLRMWRAASAPRETEAESASETTTDSTGGDGAADTLTPATSSSEASRPPIFRTYPEDEVATTSVSSPVGRRSFLVLSLVSVVASAVVGTGARLISASTASIMRIRESLRLPSPSSRVDIPAGAELDVPGISPLYTPNESFYRVDTAITVPEVDPGTWRLVVDGMVGERVELSFDDLVAMGLSEYSITLTCVSNEVGGGLVGNATWLGVPVRDILQRAQPESDADMVLSRSVDGYTASTPLSALTDDGRDAILAVAMNGEPLPLEHGFPVRMVVPGLYGYVSATKWLTELKVTRFDRDEAYWTPRGYSAEAPIKMSSRIDTPRVDSPIPAGKTAIGGMAWAQTIGIDRVEVSIDDGEWQRATLSEAVNRDTWVQWRLDWDATPGTHYLTVRAVDREGTVQTQDRAPIAPDGSSGWQRSLVTVT